MTRTCAFENKSNHTKFSIESLKKKKPWRDSTLTNKLNYVFEIKGLPGGFD